MRKPYRRRKINRPPYIRGFKPVGRSCGETDTIRISLDEYEAIRLADYLGMEHFEASENMGISRPTFTRLIEKARTKVAAALIEGSEFYIEGGHIEFINVMKKCQDCGVEKLSPSESSGEKCAGCGSSNVEDVSASFLAERKNK